ncbi:MULTISPECIES: thiol reductant ABC exporter subunit CydC [unclassified Oceanobacillus]|uniref:thiol reductant ABC exporter subunit CydC n=1 Tax=unclassified Oceanobacillus TaxID=2630292 RepID=UPI001BE9EFDE|nr:MULTISPECIES: thiol reductant ABC exporter subunit CydC [unclassified Oceanobacillus]MBT2599245.1 thiol reductant ABC exporter subunit CydC [Oceanobacillus sp. ISL-74]MBT2652163.1 thiol reductant ABC exporter subunit CydC [Oceanobacillus sp. ISL-73]
MQELKLIMKMTMKEKKDVLLSILFGFLAGVTAVSLFASSGYLISKAALTPPIYTLMIIVAMVKMLGISSALSRYGERYFSHRGTFSMLRNLRVYVYEKIEPISTTILQKYRSGDILARIVGDVESLQHFFLRVFYPPIVLMTVFIATITFTMVFSIPIAMVILIGMIFVVIVVPSLFYLYQRKIANNIRSYRGQLSSEVIEYLYGFTDLKIYGQAELKKNNILKKVTLYEQATKQANNQQAFRESLLTFVSFIVSVTVLGLAGYFVANGNLEGILLAMLFMISLTVFEDTSNMALFPAYLEETKQSARRLEEVWNVNEDKNEVKKPFVLEANLAPTITLENVTKKYSSTPRPIAQNISLHIESGSKIAIVGASGSGKSTLLQLILGMVPSTDGLIKWNEKSIDYLEKETLWNHANVSLQSNHFFYGTIRDNLHLANSEATDDELCEALDNVKLHHIRLDDLLLEQGSNLSGGEKQRLAIARLFIRKAAVWALDEPTSSLDVVTEKHIWDKIDQHSERSTVIVVTHRLTRLQKMDEIIVMDHGKVVEQGTYQNLMQYNGYFKRMKDLENAKLNL